MLQWLYTYVAKLLFPMFHMFFRRILQVLFGCCICFTHMLQLFYLDVAYVLQWFSGVFASVSDTCFKCFICLQTYVTSVVSGCFKSRSVLHPLLVFCCLASVSPPHCASCASTRGTGGCRPLPLFSMLVTFEAARALCRARETECRCRRPDISTAVSKTHKASIGRAPLVSTR
jgi:hypothetical protein